MKIRENVKQKKTDETKKNKKIEKNPKYEY